MRSVFGGDQKKKICLRGINYNFGKSVGPGSPTQQFHLLLCCNPFILLLCGVSFSWDCRALLSLSYCCFDSLHPLALSITRLYAFVDSAHAGDDAGNGLGAEARVGVRSRSHNRGRPLLEPWPETLFQSVYRSSFFISPLLGHQFLEKTRRRAVGGRGRRGNRRGAGGMGAEEFTGRAPRYID